MNDISGFVKKPEQLVAMCQAMIEQLSVNLGDFEFGEKEAQLREISRTIDRLENAQIPVPDVLRAEKTRLAAMLGLQADSTNELKTFVHELDKLLVDAKRQLFLAKSAISDRGNKPARNVSPRTPREVLRANIIQALKNLNGQAPRAEIFREMGRLLEGKFLPGDLELQGSGRRYAWQVAVKHERVHMTKAGILRNDSPQGIWALSEDHK